jgi:UDP-N-acetylglucosamine:LPS N-acetylglucosamine transferase
MNSRPLKKGLVLITDRGGHLHDALRLLDQLQMVPEALISTKGPDVNYLPQMDSLKGSRIFTFPLMFSWMGKRRLFDPFKLVVHVLLSALYALQLRPKFVVSTGASDVVFFCYFSKLLGARIYHVENLAQVNEKSVAGKLLYPICTNLFVQFEELKKLYGPKALYKGWVL